MTSLRICFIRCMSSTLRPPPVDTSPGPFVAVALARSDIRSGAIGSQGRSRRHCSICHSPDTKPPPCTRRRSSRRCQPWHGSVQQSLLAHHPTIMALSLFLWAYLRLLQSHQVRFAALSGIGLTLALLGRPMTAAGFLSLRTLLAVELFRMVRTSSTRAIAGRIVLANALPLTLGFATLAIQNNAITGDWLTSPYQLYTIHGLHVIVTDFITSPRHHPH